jgi:DNA-binding transcriptional MerR regulator/methylmalonyl-CoA mutase cobalamin-binding subunit
VCYSDWQDADLDQEVTVPIERPSTNGIPERAVPQPRYRVTAVEAMTGIPASTLRSWERRYGWPRPARTRSDQRLYSDHDVAVIRFLAQRRTEGMSIAQATGLLGATSAVDERDPDRILAQLVDALRAFQEAAAEAAFAAGERLLGLEGAVREFVPRAIESTASPEANEAAGGNGGGPPIAAEHFASNFLRRQALRLLDGLPAASGRPVLVGCGPDEQHELAALLLTLLLRVRGHRVVYLGARLPGAALEHAVAMLEPSGVAISITMAESLEQAVAWTRATRSRPGEGMRFWWGGPAVADAPDLAGRLPGEVLTGPVRDGGVAISAALATARGV